MTTPLPNGYALDSNGGYFGYIKTPDGKRMADHFGILTNGTEAWCEEFAWQENSVICKLNVTYMKAGKEMMKYSFFIIDTKTAEILKFDTVEKTNSFWEQKFGNPLPSMKTKFRNTKRK